MDFYTETHSLTGLVTYQEGSIVSKTVMKKDKGNVTLFAIDQGQQISEHTTPFDAMVCVLDGEAEITISGELFTIKAGEMIVMPENKPHALVAKKSFKMMLTMIKA